jgi:hypothetical protein
MGFAVGGAKEVFPLQISEDHGKEMSFQFFFLIDHFILKKLAK